MQTQKNPWPLLIACIGISFIAVTGWSVYRASQGVSSVTDPKYYSHGLKYNSTSIETKAAQSMGWSLTAENSENNQAPAFSLRGKDGAPITGATGSLIPAGSAPGRNGAAIPLQEIRPGVYSAPLPEDLPETVYAAITLSKDGATIRRRLILNR